MCFSGSLLKYMGQPRYNFYSKFMWKNIFRLQDWNSRPSDRYLVSSNSYKTGALHQCDQKKIAKCL